MVFLVLFEPEFWVERLSLLQPPQSALMRVILPVNDKYLFHVLVDLLTTPTIQTPIIVVLFRATNAKGSVATARATEEPAPACFDTTVVCPRAWLRYYVPVVFSVEVFGPPKAGQVRFSEL